MALKSIHRIDFSTTPFYQNPTIHPENWMSIVLMDPRLKAEDDGLGWRNSVRRPGTGGEGEEEEFSNMFVQKLMMHDFDV